MSSSWLSLTKSSSHDPGSTLYLTFRLRYADLFPFLGCRQIAHLGLRSLGNHQAFSYLQSLEIVVSAPPRQDQEYHSDPFNRMLKRCGALRKLKIDSSGRQHSESESICGLGSGWLADVLRGVHLPFLAHMDLHDVEASAFDVVAFVKANTTIKHLAITDSTWQEPGEHVVWPTEGDNIDTFLTRMNGLVHGLDRSFSLSTSVITVSLEELSRDPKLSRFAVDFQHFIKSRDAATLDVGEFLLKPRMMGGDSIWV